MKTFRYQLGHTAGTTLTVGELKKKLSEYPDDMPVLGLYEGVHGYITPERFAVDKSSAGHPDDTCDCLLIDVENY